LFEDEIFSRIILRAISIALRFASRIPTLSIISALEDQYAKRHFPCEVSLSMDERRISRFFGVSFFESVSPERREKSKSNGTQKAHAMTGHAHDQRHASSTQIR
jgi:hypothetical protein